MQQIADWLKALGLSEYTECFAENGIDVSVLRHLTDQDLKDIGVLLGHRRKMLAAIAELHGAVSAKPQPAPAIERSPQDAAERRQVTVMFADLVGSTALAARMDPEDLREVISAYQKCVAETVRRFDGFVAKYMGDGVLVYFGYPQAHEHDAERAVRAGLHLVEVVPKLTTVAAVPLQVRIGIATGLVVVGDLIGAGAAQEQAVVGETPNLAARLQALAEPGAVVIAASTRTLIGGLFEYRDLGTFALKGFAENVPAWQVLGAGVAESRFEALRATTTPLIGRDEEIDLLMRRWGQAKRGGGCVVLISGEPGIGKSRIAETIPERLSNEPHIRLRYFCSPHHQDSALYPSMAQLERATGFRRDDSDDQRLNKLESVLARGTDDLSQVVPLLADLLSIPTGDRYPPLNLAPQKRKEKTLRAQLAQVEGLSSRQPVLILFEDIHWSDPTTREWLDLLVDRVPGLRVLVIITFRPEFAPPWIGRPHVTMLNLNRLPPRRRAEMISYVTGGKTLPKDIVDQIVDRTDGVPLFIEELTKTILESGIVTDGGDRYTKAGTLTPLAIPATLHASLLARLDRLAPTREVAQIGAALGRSFSHDLISAVAPIPQQQINDALAQLVGAELILRRGTPPDAEYAFKHALVQDAAYSTLLRSRRQQLHGRIAAVLEKQFSEIMQTQPEVLARHCAEAGLTEKSVVYCLKAGQQAIARSAMIEAVAQLRKGLDLLSGMPKSTAYAEQELNLQITLGPALFATKGYGASEPGEVYARARKLCEQLNKPTQLGSVLYGQWVYCQTRGELDQARYHAEEVRRLGDARNDKTWKFFGSSFLGQTCYYLGEFTDARASFEDALALWEPTFGAFEAANDLQLAHLADLVHLSRTLHSLGYVDQARRRRDEALAEAQATSPYNFVYALCITWWVDWTIESPTTLLRSADEILATSTDQGYSLWVGFGQVMRGWCLAALGQAVEGLALLLQGIGIVRAAGCNIAIPLFLTMVAEVYEIVAQPEAALDQLAEAAKLVEATEARWAEAEMHRCRGALLLAMGKSHEAEESYHRALVVARRQAAKFWELRAATNLCRLWRDQGKPTEARDLLAPIYGWFTEGFDTPVLKEAGALLDELR
jgi:predicted ATPase/class 3 adenylate cyclase